MRTILLSTVLTVILLSGYDALCDGTWTPYSAETYHLFALHADSEYIWCGTDGGGIVRWNRSDMSYESLPNAGKYVSEIYPHPDGNLWFASRASGVTRCHDGVWITYSVDDGLPENSVQNSIKNIKAAPDGTVWVSHNTGLSSFDGKKWRTFTMPYDGDDEAHITSFRFHPDGSIWCMTHYRPYFYRLESGEWSVVTPGLDFGIYSSPTNFFITESGDVFVQHYYEYYRKEGGGISRYDGGSWERFSSSQGLPHDMINAMALDNDDRVWVTTERGIAVFENGAWSTINGENIGASSIAVTPENDIWFSAEQVILRYIGGSFDRFTADEGVMPDRRRRIAVGPDGEIWCGWKGFVSRFDGTRFINSQQEPWIGDIIHEIEIGTDGAVWFLSTECITKLKDGHLQTFFDNGFRMAVGPDGLLWMLRSDSVLRRYDGKEWTSYSDETIQGKTPVSIDVCDDGTVWMCFNSYKDITIVSYDGTTWRSQSIPDEYKNDFAITAKIDHSGTVWLITDEKVFRIEKGTWTPVPDVSNFAEALEIGPDNTIWIGASIDGIYRFDGASWTTYPWNANLITASGDGGVWFVSNPGIGHYDGETVRTYTTDDGLPSNYTRALAVAPDGTVWAATDGGLMRFDPPTSVQEGQGNRQPIAFGITAIRPNPFNPSTTVVFTLASEAAVDLTVYNTLGQQVRTLAAETLTAGLHAVRWDGRDDEGAPVSSGVYIVRMRTGDTVATRSMTLVR